MIHSCCESGFTFNVLFWRGQAINLINKICAYLWRLLGDEVTTIAAFVVLFGVIYFGYSSDYKSIQIATHLVVFVPMLGCCFWALYKKVESDLWYIYALAMMAKAVLYLMTAAMFYAAVRLLMTIVEG